MAEVFNTLLRILLIINGLYEFALAIVMFTNPGSMIGEIGHGANMVGRILGCNSLAFGCYSILSCVKVDLNANISLITFSVLHILVTIASGLNLGLDKGYVGNLIPHIILAFFFVLFFLIQMIRGAKK